MITTIVISDIRIYCEGLGQILTSTGFIKVVGAEDNLEDASNRIKQHSVDVILLDMRMAGSSCLAARLAKICPDGKIVALAVSEDEDNIIECAEAGIAGYIAREAGLDDLIETVIGVKKGEFCCPPKIAACIFSKVKNIAKDAKKKYLPKVVDESLFEELTKRERQIVTLLADGLSNKQISRSLTIEVSTVKNHVHNILVKLDVRSRTQAVLRIQRLSHADVFETLDLDPDLKTCYSTRP